MKKIFIFAFFISVIFFASCAGNNTKTAKAITELYGEITEKFSEIADDVIAANNGELSENYTRLGEKILAFSDAVRTELPKMTAEEAEKLKDKLSDLKKQLDETAGVISDAAAGGYNFEFELYNNSKKEIAEINMSPSGINRWSKNLISKGKTLKPGEIVIIKNSRTDPNLESWDIRFILSTGEEVIKQNVIIKEKYIFE